LVRNEEFLISRNKVSPVFIPCLVYDGGKPFYGVHMSNSLSRFKVKFIIEGVGEAEGELNRIHAPRTVEALRDALPISGRANIWKEKEVYFTVGIKKGLEKPTKKVEKGTLAYWPVGDALCIFFEELEPYSEVNIVGKITSNLEIFGKVRRGNRIEIRLA